jgi:hypothetical protein
MKSDTSLARAQRMVPIGPGIPSIPFGPTTDNPYHWLGQGNASVQPVQSMSVEARKPTKPGQVPPGQKMCPACSGKGSYQEMGEEKCGPCMGTGRDLKEDLWAAPCRTCNGRGKITYCRRVTCGRCHGNGWIF